MNEKLPTKVPKRNRTKWLVILLLTLVLIGQVRILTASATPSAPVQLVNHTLKQCIDNVILSDECHVCQPVEDWEVTLPAQCPSGYKTIPIQSFADKDRLVNCVEYPKNEWAACAWGSYPSMTPALSATPTPEVINRSSDHFLPVLCMGSIIGISAISFILVVLKRKSVMR